jgi:hypothetical protein
MPEREYQIERGGQGQGQGLRHLRPTGPWLVTKDEVPDPQNPPCGSRSMGALPERQHQDDDLNAEAGPYLSHHEPATRRRSPPARRPASAWQKPNPII